MRVWVCLIGGGWIGGGGGSVADLPYLVKLKKIRWFA